MSDDAETIIAGLIVTIGLALIAWAIYNNNNAIYKANKGYINYYNNASKKDLETCTQRDIDYRKEFFNMTESERKSELGQCVKLLNRR